MEEQKIFEIITDKNEVFALFDDNKSESGMNALLYSPYKKITASSEIGLLEAISEIENLSKQGFYLAGYITYEAGHLLIDKKITSAKTFSSGTFIVFYAFNNIEYIESSKLNSIFKKIDSSINKAVGVYDLSLNESKDSYIKSLGRVKDYLRNGDSYQVNYTMKYEFKIQGEPFHIYSKLRQNQKVSYGAYFNFEDEKILSLSPELFFEKRNDLIITKPMKGTAKRGKDLIEDDFIKDTLKNDSKTISENVMIVDLLRNDLGRICEPGSVQVKSLFEIQTFETVHQMISTIQGKVNPKINLLNIIKEIFPCGSITGAPKIRTMNIIDELELDSRGVYTGALGFLLPNNNFSFNVPIRTIRIFNDMAEMGIGSGIVYESDPHMEYEECLLKSKFLLNVNDSFFISEAMNYNTTYPNKKILNDFIFSISISANKFGFKIPGDIEKHIGEYLKSMLGGDFRIIINLFKNGDFNLRHDPIIDRSNHHHVIIHEHIIDSKSPFSYHNTSFNKLVEVSYNQDQLEGVFDVLFMNENGFITQASDHVLFISNGGDFITPPISSGVKTNSFREEFVLNNNVIEKDITLFDLKSAESIWLGSHFTGLKKVILHKFKGVGA